jgi:hypothetical protein
MSCVATIYRLKNLLQVSKKGATSRHREGWLYTKWLSQTADAIHAGTLSTADSQVLEALSRAADYTYSECTRIRKAFQLTATRLLAAPQIKWLFSTWLDYQGREADKRDDAQSGRVFREAASTFKSWYPWYQAIPKYSPIGPIKEAMKRRRGDELDSEDHEVQSKRSRSDTSLAGSEKEIAPRPLDPSSFADPVDSELAWTLVPVSKRSKRTQDNADIPLWRDTTRYRQRLSRLQRQPSRTSDIINGLSPDSEMGKLQDYLCTSSLWGMCSRLMAGRIDPHAVSPTGDRFTSYVNDAATFIRHGTLQEDQRRVLHALGVAAAYTEKTCKETESKVTLRPGEQVILPSNVKWLMHQHLEGELRRSEEAGDAARVTTYGQSLEMMDRWYPRFRTEEDYSPETRLEQLATARAKRAGSTTASKRSDKGNVRAAECD